MTLHGRPHRQRESQRETFVNQVAAEETVQLHCLIPSAMHRQLRVLAAQEGTTVTSLVLEALDGYLTDRE